MKESLRKLVFEFAELVSQYEILYIVLFGSVLKEKETRESDVDFFVVLDTAEEVSSRPERKKIQSIAFMLENRYNRNLQVIISNRKYDSLEDYFVQKVFSEGLILYAKKLSLKLNNISMKPYVFISYDLRKLDHSEKMKLRNILFGYKTRKKHKKKIYTATKPGLVKKLGGRKIGIGTFMLPKENLSQLEKVLNSFNILYKTIDTWIYA
ncbi:MAG: nucleotidyltransferase domain-containing protein [Omnitrophica bacterium]|nr:nucleotidyltransferase domain-containing protein [Candidatus Omnitrophota bacterium]